MYRNVPFYIHIFQDMQRILAGAASHLVDLSWRSDLSLASSIAVRVQIGPVPPAKITSR
jgi:hypothetical protein